MQDITHVSDNCCVTVRNRYLACLHPWHFLFNNTHNENENRSDVSVSIKKFKSLKVQATLISLQTAFSVLFAFGYYFSICNNQQSLQKASTENNIH